jgi:hypothetical protein
VASETGDVSGEVSLASKTRAGLGALLGWGVAVGDGVRATLGEGLGVGLALGEGLDVVVGLGKGLGITLGSRVAAGVCVAAARDGAGVSVPATTATAGWFVTSEPCAWLVLRRARTNHASNRMMNHPCRLSAAFTWKEFITHGWARELRNRQTSCTTNRLA